MLQAIARNIMLQMQQLLILRSHIHTHARLTNATGVQDVLHFEFSSLGSNVSVRSDEHEHKCNDVER
jgi:hypothetical protein